MVKVLVQRSGRALIEQGGHRGVVDGRFLTIYDTAAPYTLAQTMDFHADAILIPRERLPMTASNFLAVQDKPLDLRYGAGAIFTSHLDSFLTQLDACSDAVAARCASVLVELLAASLVGLPTKSLSADALRENAILWIDGHLADLDLTPAAVAAGINVSVRYLHRLFEGSGTTVAGHIRNQRLYRIRMDLLDPRFSEQTIARIGERWAMLDPMYLSRVFRSKFGCTPGDIRN